MSDPLKLVVVGHTNVGKTSLLRTLLRDAGFGEVSHRPGTTRHVEGARLSVEGESLLELYDTPGLEDAIALLDYLERLDRPGERLDGPARVERFLQGAEARQRFEQEAKVLRQLLLSDAALYVIDAREPVLAKYRDELAVLAMCGRPLLPVLNFVADGGEAAREAEWRGSLARLGLHALVCFDSVAPPLDGERRLFESLALMQQHYRPQLQRLIDDRERQRRRRLEAGARLIAELLIDCAACRHSVDAEAVQAVEALQQAVRQREQRCVDALLQLYRFRAGDVHGDDLPLLDGRWQSDLFHPETLRQLGVRIGGGMAAGAAAGAGVDLLVGGITLGTAAAIGALLGGAAQTVRRYGDRLKGAFGGRRELTVDDAILRLLALRQQQLLQALEARGHAAQQVIELPLPQAQRWRDGELPEALTRARAHPEWSSLKGASLNGGAVAQGRDRESQIERLSADLLAGCSL